jgi:hypothetical protein
MRSQRNYINEDGTSNIQSSFLSCEKDTELIIRKLFVDSRPYSDELKRLILINTPDCLDSRARTNQAYIDKITNTSLKDLIKEGYIRLQPRLNMHENEEVKSYILISYDNFTPSSNEHYRDCYVEIDILCHIDEWEMTNYRQRPIKIAGYVDGILNGSKLTGIGTLNFVSANEIVLNENLAGYCLMYRAVHGDDDTIDG